MTISDAPLMVVKIGGNELDTPAFQQALPAALAQAAGPLLLVHGGGKEISAALEHYGEPVQFHEGLRVTPPSSMAIMEMVVCGRINKRLVAQLVAAGLPALGLSGVDLGLLRALPLRPDGYDLGRVGEISAVDVPRLAVLLAAGWLPVLAPVALGAADHQPYNVNADHVAHGVAAALAAHPSQHGRPVDLVFVSNVPGVLQAGAVVPHLTPAAIARDIQAGTISGGMIPKVRSALGALAAGVASVRITNLAGFANGGTRITAA